MKEYQTVNRENSQIDLNKLQLGWNVDHVDIRYRIEYMINERKKNGYYSNHSLLLSTCTC